MSESREPMFKPSFTPTIDAGHILQAVVMAGAALLWVFAVGGKADEANRKVDDLKVVMSEKIAELKVSIDVLTRQIAAFPSVAARLDQVERAGEVTNHNVSLLDAHVQAVDQRSIQNAADIANMLRSSVPLVPRGR